MNGEMKVRIHHLTRVEGHGDVVIEIGGDGTMAVRFEIVEAPRLFEVFLRGHHHEEVVHMASRICGICAISHKCAALKATESALNVRISEQTELLRRLAFHGEVVSSHILHVYFLAAPDFLKLKSIFPLVTTDRETVLRGMRLKKLAYDLSALVAGRHTHPVAMRTGGFTFVHSEKKFAEMRKRLLGGIEDLLSTVRIFRTMNIPSFERETRYVSLRHADHYAFYDGDLFSSNGEKHSAGNYRRIIEEFVVPHSSAKHARWKKSPYMVGALARFNNNFGQLSPLAAESALQLDLSSPCRNPFMNTVAQIVECIHCLEESIEIIDKLLGRGINADDEFTEPQDRAGAGIGAVEAPRGLLLHEYRYDENGKCTDVNLVIPTAQNLANMNADMEEYLPILLKEPRETIVQRMEMLVRAYDPCISCSVH